MELSIKTNLPNIDRWLAGYPQAVVRPAMVRALNRAAEQGKTAMSREIRAEFNIKADLLRDRLRVERAKVSGSQLGLNAKLVGTDPKRSINLIHFLERSVTLSAGKRRKKAGVAGQIFVQVKRKGGKKSLGPAAFIGNKGRTIFARVPGTTMPSRQKYGGSKHAEKIKPLQTINVPGMFRARRVSEVVKAKMLAAFSARIGHEVAFAAKAHRAKGAAK